jgi:phosphoribosylglycinamide formyltransferase-1
MAEKVNLGVFASGGGTNLQAIMDNCEAGRVDARVAVVISDQEDAGALQRARDHDIPWEHVPIGRDRAEQFLEADERHAEILQAHQVDLVVLAGYMRRIGPAVLEAYRNAVMNIHPALLPSFPGVHGQRDAVEYAVKVSGCTVHFADPEFDTGPIIIQAAVAVMQDDTEDSLGARILEQEHRIYSQAIQWFAEGRLRVEGRMVRLEPEAEPSVEVEPGVTISPPLTAEL